MYTCISPIKLLHGDFYRPGEDISDHKYLTLTPGEKDYFRLKVEQTRPLVEESPKRNDEDSPAIDFSSGLSSSSYDSSDFNSSADSSDYGGGGDFGGGGSSDSW